MGNLFFVLFAVLLRCSCLESCPVSCTCSNYYYNPSMYVDCSERLGSIPTDLPNKILDLDMSSNNLIALDVYICQQSPDLRSLNLGHNRLSEIPEGYFSECRGLYSLNLEHNSFYIIDKEGFRNLNTLTYLNMNNNKILTLDVAICQLFPRLSTLLLHYNQISKFGNYTFKECSRINTIGLSHNLIQSIPSNLVQDCVSLFSMSLDYNEIKEIKRDSFVGCQRLTYLELSHNPISSIQNYSFTECQQLVTLRIEDAVLTEVDDILVFNLTKLKNLYLQNNRINYIHKNAFRSLHSVNTLNLGGNDISEIPEDVFLECPELTYLFLNGNRIIEIRNSTFNGCSKLRNLHIDKNQILNVQNYSFVECQNLEIMYLMENKISEIHSNSFTGLHSLKELYIMKNRISEIHSYSFTGLHALNKIVLTDNQLQKIHDYAFSDCSMEDLLIDNSVVAVIDEFSFANITKVTRLYLRNNNISRIHPRAFNTLQSLKELFIDNSQLQRIETFAFANISNLQQLSLKDNLISEIESYSFIGCESLKSIVLTNNHLLRIHDYAFSDCSMDELLIDNSIVAVIDELSFANISSVTSLYLGNNNISRIHPRAFNTLQSLRNLFIDYSQLHKIETFAFANISNLQLLSLKGNLISEIESYSFTGCKSLKTILLTANQIDKIHAYAFANCYVNNLVLDNSKISVIEELAFANISKLLRLNLQNNNISIIHPRAFSTIQSMQMLNLSNNHITEIQTETFAGCNSLTNLVLTNNEISEIQNASFIDCHQLNDMSINRNSLTTIGELALANITELQNLDLSENSISLIHSKAFGSLPSLRILNLSKNNLSKMELEEPVVPELRYLNLAGNIIANLPDHLFNDCYSLYELNLNDNQLTETPRHFFRHNYTLHTILMRRNHFRIIDEFTFANISNLQTLDLSENEISVIHPKAFLGLRHLYNLYMGNNEITDIDPQLTRRVYYLRRLWLNDNKLTVIQGNTFRYMNNLYELNLNNNNISIIEESAFGPSHIGRLYMTSNPLACDCSILSFYLFLTRNAGYIRHYSESYSPRCLNGTLVASLSKTAVIRCDPAIPWVDVDLLEGPVFPIPGLPATPSLQPVFTCISRNMLNDTYIYDVYWYINGDLILTKFNQTAEDSEATILRDKDWINTHRMNMVVKCAVRYRNSTDIGPFIYSEHFHAGLKPNRYFFNVYEGEPIEITFTSTVPVGCIASHEAIRRHCGQNIYVFQPKFDKETVTCVNDVTKRDVVFEAEFCGINIMSMNWTDRNTLKVFGFSDGLYNYKGRKTYIKLSTTSVSTLNDMWKNIEVPEIQITVLDKDMLLVNRMCQIHNDPHVRSFDGATFDYMAIGEYVMYRNEKGPYVVHVLFTSCLNGIAGPSCLCGVAIRSRKSLFVFRTCQKISRSKIHPLQRPVIRQVSCDENDMFIEQSKNSYKITLPHGTEIKFSVYKLSRFISGVSIKPSVHDLNTARGLCGFPNTKQDASDDFTHRFDGPVSDMKFFADSWSIGPDMIEEQLFVDNPEFFNSTIDNEALLNFDESNGRHYCACENQAGTMDAVQDFYTLHCNLTETTEHCSGTNKTNGVTGTDLSLCNNNNRKRRAIYSAHQRMRRSASESDDAVEFQPLTYDEDAFNNESEVLESFRDEWTYDKAYIICSEAIENALPKNLDQSLSGLPRNYFIGACVKDIELTADTTFLPDTISAMVTFIMSELLRNESLYYQSTVDGTQTILDYITSHLCPNNCSNKGYCVLGACSCLNGSAGEDCSQNITVPPSNISLPYEGLCTLGTRTCRKTNIFGDFPSTNVWCHLKHFQIKENITGYTANDYTLMAEYRNMYMVTVNLPVIRKKRSTSENVMAYGYDMRLSNDGINFGNTVKLIIYDEACYSCNFSTVSCVDLGTCKAAVSNNDNSTTLTAIGSIVAVLLAICVVIGVVLVKLKQKNKATKVGNTGDNKETDLGYGIRGDIWISRAITISDLEFDIEDCFQALPREISGKQFAPESHKTHF